MNDRRERIERLSAEQRAHLVGALRQKALRAAEASIPRRREQSGSIPLSYAQHGLWVVDQLQPGGDAYNELSALEILGPLQVPVLKRCLTEIVRRHETLRTTFATHRDDAVQVIGAPSSVSLGTVDLEGLAPDQRRIRIAQLADEEVHAHFDLARGPLVRFTLVRLGIEAHLLLIGVHHIVFDGWSIGIFRRELAELYGAFAGGRPVPFADLPIQYADYVAWQREEMSPQLLDAQLDYWVQELRDLPPLLRLPVATDQPREARFKGALHHFRVTAEQTAALKALSRRADVTLFMTLLSGFQILLYRYSGQADIAVGTAVANRNHPQLEHLIGLFVNTVVLRVDLTGDPSVVELLQRVGRVALNAYDHSEVPFEAVVQALRPDRLPDYSPLFQVMFTLQNMPREQGHLPGLTFTPSDVGSRPAKFDLIVSLEETSDGMRGYWQYRTDVFDPDTIERLNGNLQTLWAAMVAEPEESITKLSILTAEERRRILVEWNDTALDHSSLDRCIHQLVEDQVARTPYDIAVIQGDQSISYRDLDRRADYLARGLRQAGVVPDRPVGIYLTPSIDMIVAILGTLKAGGAYVPLDPSYPSQWLEDAATKAGLALVVTEEKRKSQVPTRIASILCVDSPFGVCESSGEVSTVGPHHAAYIIYTSGSTGAPKGVVVTHANVVHSTVARWKYYEEPIAAFLLISSFAFDSSVAGIFWTLTRGGELILPTSPILDVEELCHLTKAHRVSHLLGIPSIYAAILEQAEGDQLASLRTIIVAGEACPPNLVEEHRRRLPNTTLFNEYGPTEATVWSTVHRCDSMHGLSVPIGRPIANTTAFILDAHLEPVPIGVPAELYIGGGGVARGYLNEPEATSEKFLSAPGTSARLYKTGDLARHLPNGTLTLVGRADRQVKVRGCRVELGEIEAVLLGHRAVREAHAMVHDQEDGRQRLMAFVTVSSTVAVEELRRWVEGKLPIYASPSEIQIRNNLPRLPNGKVDSKQLAALSAPSVTVDLPGDEWTTLERSIAEIWKATLNLASVGRNDNFFQVGGDSLAVIRVHNRLREVTHRRLAITDLFKHTTISTLARFIESGSVVGEI